MSTIRDVCAREFSTSIGEALPQLVCGYVPENLSQTYHLHAGVFFGPSEDIKLLFSAFGQDAASIFIEELKIPSLTAVIVGGALRYHPWVYLLRTYWFDLYPHFLITRVIPVPHLDDQLLDINCQAFSHLVCVSDRQPRAFYREHFVVQD